MIKLKRLLMERGLKLFAAIFLASLTAITLTTCGGGGGSGDGGGGGSSSGGSGGGGNNVIQPVSASGQVTAPASVTPSTLKVVSGIDSKSVNSDGSFSLNLNKDNTQLVMASDSQDNPVLMAVVVNAQSGSTVSISTASTAEALIYFSPGVTQTNTTDSETVMSYIRSLPETTTLANLLSTKLASNPNILSSNPPDPEITTAISNALQALINKVKSSGGITQANSLLGRLIAFMEVAKAQAAVNPSNASGLFVSFDNTTKTLSVENRGKKGIGGQVYTLDEGNMRVERKQDGHVLKYKF